MPAEHSELPAPVPIALVVCDAVYESPNGKRALIGLFDRISATQFPAEHPQLSVYVSITGVHRFTRCKLDIVHGETDEPVVTAEGPMPEQAGPVAIWELVFQFERLRFPEEGTYFVRFWGNDQILVQKPVKLGKLRGSNG